MRLRRPRPSTAAVVFAAVGSLLLTGCGDAGVGSSGGAPDGAWRLVEGVGPEGEIPIPPEAPITLDIDGEQWGGTAACNSYGGTIHLDGDALIVREVFQTEMACLDDRLMEAERRYLEAFMRAERVEVDGDRLVLRGDDVELIYTEVAPEPDAALIGTTWVLSSLVEDAGTDDGAVTSVIGEPTLVFDADGGFVGETGCNRFGGPFSERGGTITTGEVTSSAVDCPDELSAHQDRQIVDILHDADLTVSIEGRSLTLTATDGRGLHYLADDDAQQ